MMQMARFILLSILISLSAFCNAPKNRSESYPYTLGGTKIIAERISFDGADSIQLLQLHHNERTAENVALSVLKEKGGSLLHLTNSGKRLVKFRYKKQTFEFDPNRIFTTTGRKETLEKNCRYTTAAEKLLAGFALHLLDLINRGAVISLHNNTDGAFSINSYYTGGTNAVDAAQIHINSAQDADNFFLTTDLLVFESIKALDYNIVLQNNELATDDGSLSVYCGRAGVPYVNIEAQHGDAESQREMLEVLLTVLKK